MADATTANSRRQEWAAFTKWIAENAVTVSALGIFLGLVYDTFYWLVVDLRMLGTYTIADHIETAVIAVVPLALVTASIIGVRGLLRWHEHRGKQSETPDIVIRPDKSAWIVFGLLVVTMTVFGLGNGALESGLFKYKSSKDISSTIALEARDTVALDNDKEIPGHVLRIVDRGVILRDPKENRVYFIPKERVRWVKRGPVDRWESASRSEAVIQSDRPVVAKWPLAVTHVARLD